MKLHIVFARESIRDCWAELLALAQNQYATMRPFGLRQCKPDLEVYAAAEVRLRVFTARDAQTQRLAGYGVFLISPTSHDSDSLQALADAVYLHPDFRHGPVGLEFLGYMERELAGDGVELILHECLTEHPTLKVLLERRGYRPMATLMGREL